MTRAAHRAVHVLTLVTLAIARTLTVTAQEQPLATTASGKQAHARRVAEGEIRLDGRLDEQIWELLPPLTDFVQKEPIEGASPTQRTEVRFAYDSRALYVGFRLWSQDPSMIQAPLGRRDSVDQAEHVTVSLDTYHDRRTAYTFGVTASGVRIDRFHPADTEDGADAGFDPVWEARTAMSATGWSAELRIPFSQLRFNESPDQIWGLNISRVTPTLNEVEYWALVPRTVTAWASRFGDLVGLEDVRSVKRLELLPYVSGSAAFTGPVDPGNPFDDGQHVGGRLGLDVKVGIGSSLTLDAAVNPDFGQVDADPAEVNLSAFETIFPEKRPFFTEGARLMNLGFSSGMNLFNSRRIGARPIGPASGPYVDYPEASTILMSAKLTGRTSSGTSVGILGALTDHETARVVDAASDVIRRVRVAPRATYGVGRVQQEFGSLGSTVSAMGTVVLRDFDSSDPLSALLPQKAFGLGSDSIIRLRGGEYEIGLLGLMSHVSGEPAAIERLQRTSTHYFQRPDRDYSRIDPTRQSLNGYKAIAGIERLNGRHWLWNTEVTAISPGLDTNDIGRTLTADGLRHIAGLTYRETEPGRIFRAYSLALTVNNEWTYDKDSIVRSFRPLTNFTFTNFWTASAGVTRTLRVLDPVLTRGGPLMGRPAGWSATASLANAATSQTRWTGSTVLSRNEDGGKVQRVNGSFAFRPGPRWQLSVQPEVDRTLDVQQYVTTLNDGGAQTYGRRYLFSSIDRTTISSEFRMSFTLRPDLNIDVYGEPFTSSGRYEGLGELLRAGSRERIAYGTFGTTLERDATGAWIVTGDNLAFRLTNPDFVVRSFRSNVVLRWEWRPGSLLHIVWQQSREDREIMGARAGLGDLLGSFTAPGRNFLAIKTSFWLPVP